MGAYFGLKRKEINRIKEVNRIKEAANSNSVKPVQATADISNEEYKKVTGRNRTSSTLLGG